MSGGWTRSILRFFWPRSTSDPWAQGDPLYIAYLSAYIAQPSMFSPVVIEMSALEDLTNVEAQTASRMDNNEAEKKKAKISWSEAMKVIVGYKKKEAKKPYTYPPMDPTYY